MQPHAGQPSRARDCSLNIYLLLREGSFRSTGQAQGEGSGLLALGFASQYGWDVWHPERIGLGGSLPWLFPPDCCMARDGEHSHGCQPPSPDPWGHSYLCLLP